MSPQAEFIALKTILAEKSKTGELLEMFLELEELTTALDDKSNLENLGNGGQNSFNQKLKPLSEKFMSQWADLFDCFQRYTKLRIRMNLESLGMNAENYKLD